ncbi:MAG: carboxypeptidase-like regulatory domain-containing protein [Cyclobacteriaceae bacterium]
MRITLLIIYSCLISSLMGYGQSYTGTVVDDATEEVLPFTNIHVIEHNLGTISNVEGVFVLDQALLSLDDSVKFSFVGYETLKIHISELQRQNVVRLQPAIINLDEVAVTSKEVDVKDIVKQIKERYEQNYPEVNAKRRIFYHRFEKTPFGEENAIKIKQSDFGGLDKETIKELIDQLPKEFIDYQDAVVDLYVENDESKLVSIDAVSKEASSVQDIGKELEKRLEGLLEDIRQTQQNEEVYYKFRSGILAFKAELNPEDTISFDEIDTNFYEVPVPHIKGNINYVFKEFASLEGKNWQFINHPGKYKYELLRVSLMEESLVYEIAFKPRVGGLFEGLMYVDINDFGVPMMEYNYASEKTSQNIDILGVSHSMRDMTGRVIFRKDTDGYHLKYVSATQNEFSAIDRPFSIMKKQRRWLFDKELSELKMKLQIDFDVHTSWEILVMNQEAIDQSMYTGIEESKKIRFMKEYVESAEMWSQGTAIAPKQELAHFSTNK